MPLTHAILLGLVEGLTELLPVSSTGHLILLDVWLKHGGPESKTLDIVIQLGAVLAIALYFRDKLSTHARGVIARDRDSVRLAMSLSVAFLPAAVVGLALHHWIEDHLFGPLPVSLGLGAGALVMLGAERWQRTHPGENGLERVTLKRAFVIGLCQCAALWPGTSRSMTTIVGGQLCRLDRHTAAEFSFLLALPTLGAATLYDLLKGGRAVLAMDGGGTALVVGTLVSFAVTWVVIAVFLRYVSRTGLVPFALYRLVLAAVVATLATRVP